MRSTTNVYSNSTITNQQYELEAEALVNLVNKLVTKIDERLKGMTNSAFDRNSKINFGHSNVHLLI